MAIIMKLIQELQYDFPFTTILKSSELNYQEQRGEITWTEVAKKTKSVKSMAFTLFFWTGKCIKTCVSHE